jgi:CheY-like chemotaxis protein
LHQDASIPEHRRQAVETIKRSGEHLSSLIEDILDIARIEARKFELKYQAINFSNFIDYLVNTYKEQAEDKGLNFNCHIVSTLPQRVRGDEKRVGQILINLLSNAIKFTSHGEITLRISYSGGVATFYVIDTGRGIDEKQLQQVFQPFTRLNTLTGNAVAGSGLGLTISKILTEVMGGELTVTSQLGHGSTFAVRLLLPSLATEAEQNSELPVIGYQGVRRKILVVDDQRDHRQLLTAILEPLGFQISEASSGESCLLKVQREKPDLKQYLALTWLYQAPVEPQIKPVAVSAMEIPPSELVQACINYVRMGDLLALKQTVDTLSVSHPQYAVFFAKLKSLANEFKVGEIRKLLNISRQES